MAGVTENRKRKRDEKHAPEADEEITDISSSEENANIEEDDVEEELDSEEEFEGENPADKRRRLAKQYLENLKTEAKEILTAERAEAEESARAIDDYNNFDAGDLDKEIISSRLKEDVAEQQGRVFRFIADKLDIENAYTTFTRVGENNLTGLSCYQPQINKFDHNTFGKSNNSKKLYCYTVSKDMTLTKYDITDFKARPKKVKSTKGGKQYISEGKTEYENTTEGHYGQILAVAASPKGDFVVTGGRDRKLIVWSTESLAPVKVIPTKDRKGEVLSLVFRRNSDQLYVACADYKIRTYSISQFSQLETLYGHHDVVVDISALGMERCVTVGSRDRTAMLWKIPDETRLTFRGGEDPERMLKKWMKANAVEKEDGEVEYPDESEAPLFFGEGSIDVVSMIDDSHFITGSDNGSISLWSLSKKKPLFIERSAHGVMDPPTPEEISGEADKDVRIKQVQDKKLIKPYWITALYAIPYSNMFISGSWNGSLKVWKLSENLREFELVNELANCKGVVTKIQCVETGKHGRETFRVLATVSKEHRLGRWISKSQGARNGIFSAVLKTKA